MSTYVISVWASCQIRNIAGCACAWNAGNVFPRCRLQRKLLVSDPGMHHGTCVTHVPWCTSVSLTRGGGENVLGIPRACAPAIVRICTRPIELIIAIRMRPPENHVSNYKKPDCLFNGLFMLTAKEHHRLKLLALYQGFRKVTGGFPWHRASNVGSV